MNATHDPRADMRLPIIPFFSGSSFSKYSQH